MIATIKLSIAEVRSALADFDYTLAKNGGELEARPKGTRRGGDLAVFEHDDEDGSGRRALIATVREEAKRTFARKLEGLPVNDETKEALKAWFAWHGREWRDKLLYQAWMYGRYDCPPNNDVSSTLQRLRNTNGHRVLEMIR